MSGNPEAREHLLSLLDEILGPEPLEVLRGQLTAEFGPDIALPVMRTVRPAVEQMQAQWHECRREFLADIAGNARVRVLHQPRGEFTGCGLCGTIRPCPTQAALDRTETDQ